MSFFRAFQLNIRNALVHAEHAMRLTKENFRTTLALIDMLSEQRYEVFGLGEDIVEQAGVELVDDRLTVAEDAAEPGYVKFAPISYPWALRIEDVFVDGAAVEWQIKKTYSDKPPASFNAAQLPLITDNLQLYVAIQPGGFLRRAAVLQKMTME
jgi:hypothetical protein